MLSAASISGLCVCPSTLQARVCNKATRGKGVIRPRDKVTYRSCPHLIPLPLAHTCTIFLLYHPHFFSLSLHPHFFTLFLFIHIFLVLLSFSIYSDNSKSFFYPNDFEITGLDCMILISYLKTFKHKKYMTIERVTTQFLSVLYMLF